MPAVADLELEPDAAERPAMEHVVEMLLRVQASPGERQAQLISPDGDRADLPRPLYEALALVAAALSEGKGVSIMPRSAELTSQQAADLLHVSRSYLLQLLNAGAMPYSRTDGGHRRVALHDVLAYRQRRLEERREKLDELTRLSDELGLYDPSFEEPEIIERPEH